MWDHKNYWLYKTNRGIHSKEHEVINIAIRFEFTIGWNGLTSDYADLFRGGVEGLIKKDINHKVQ